MLSGLRKVHTRNGTKRGALRHTTAQVTELHHVYHGPQYLGWHLHAVFLHVQDGIRDLDVDGIEHKFDVEGSSQPACHQQHRICQQRFTDSVNVSALTSGCLHSCFYARSGACQRTKRELQTASPVQATNNRKQRENLSKLSFKQTNAMFNTEIQIWCLSEDPVHQIPIKFQCAEFINSWKLW